MARRRFPMSIPTLRLLAGLSLSILIGWPLLRPLVAATDDIALLLFPQEFSSVYDALRANWAQPLFRPLAVLSSFLTDPATRECRPVFVLHCGFFGLAALAVDRIVASHMSRDGVIRALALLLWLLHPSTSVALWQMDTLSQTASAAAGLWLVVLALGSWRPKRFVAAWIALTCLGLLTKETFLGWVFAAICWCRWDVLRSRDWRAGMGPLSSALLALAYLACRAPVWSTTAWAHDGGYTPHLGFTTIRNILLCVAGLFSVGPTHALFASPRWSMPWMVTVVGTASACLVYASYALNQHRSAGTWILLSLLALIPVLPMAHVSELYLFGPNAMFAVGLAGAFFDAERRHPASARSLLFVFTLAGLLGLVSRAYHFDLTWSYSRELALQVERIEAGSVVRGIRRPCLAVSGASYGAFVVTPISAVNTGVTSSLEGSRGHVLPDKWEDRLDCSGLRERHPW